MPIRPQFSGHETFALRAGWPKKAYDAALADAGVFSDDAALARLGVGKNMVRSIRHWALALGVAEEAGRGAVAVTPFGRLLLDSDGGLDPFLEDAGTAWLLHWRLCRAAGPASLWHFVFGRWHGTDIGRGGLAALADGVEAWLAQSDAAGAAPALTTLGRDAECLKNCYLPARTLRGDLEDRLASPLADLGLVATFDGGPVVRRGAAHGLPPWVFAHAVLDFWDAAHAGRTTLAFGDVIHAPGSPGRVFGLSDEAAFDLVDGLEREREAPFSFRDTAGIRQFFRTTPAMSPEAALRRHYAGTFAGTHVFA